MTSILIPPKVQYIDSNGPIVGGLIWTYAAGTNVAKATYQDYDGLIVNTNPVILDAEGRASIWLSGAYKIVVTEPGGSPSVPSSVIYTADDVISYTDVDFSGLTATIDDLNSTTTTGILTTASYTTLFADRGKTVLANAASTDINISLLPINQVPNKWKICIKKIDFSANLVHILTNASELIDGFDNHILYDYGDFIELMADGSQWRIVAYGSRGTIINTSASLTINLSHNGKTILADLSSGNITITVPAITTLGRGFTFTVKTSASLGANKAIINPNAPNTIDGLSAFNVLGGYQSVTLKANTNDWYTINNSEGNTAKVYSGVVVTANNYNIIDISLPQPYNGMAIKVYFSTINTGTTTLSINSGTAHPIKMRLSTAATVNLEGGEIGGGYYDLIWISGDAMWQLSPITFSVNANLTSGTGLLIPRLADIHALTGGIRLAAAIAFSDNAGAITVLKSYNTSVSTSGEGFYHIAFTTPVANTNYFVQCSSEAIGTGVDDDYTITNITSNSIATTGLGITVLQHHNDIHPDPVYTKYTSVMVYFLN